MVGIAINGPPQGMPVYNSMAAEDWQLYYFCTNGLPLTYRHFV
jgi:hypothetical protein